MRRKWLLIVSVVAAFLASPDVRAQTHVLFGDLTVHGEKGETEQKGAYRIILTSITGTVVGRQNVTNGGRYRFLSVANGDYILTVELGTQEVARINLLINELRSTDIRKNLELEWKPQFPIRQEPPRAVLVYARPPDQEHLLLKAQQAQEAGDYPRAEALLVQLVQSDSRDYEAWTELGSVRFHLQKLEPAKEAYLEALQLQPDLQVARHNLGKLYFHDKQFEAAIQEFEKLLATAAELAEGHMFLGEAYLQVQKGSKAVPHFQKALELEPLEMAEAHLRLAALYRKAGYSELAVAEYRKYLEKRPDFAGRKEIEEYIQQNPPKY